MLGFTELCCLFGDYRFVVYLFSRYLYSSTTLLELLVTSRGEAVVVCFAEEEEEGGVSRVVRLNRGLFVPSVRCWWKTRFVHRFITGITCHMNRQWPEMSP